jgi:hypothetical protein
LPAAANYIAADDGGVGETSGDADGLGEASGDGDASGGGIGDVSGDGIGEGEGFCLGVGLVCGVARFVAPLALSNECPIMTDHEATATKTHNAIGAMSMSFFPFICCPPWFV